MVVGCVQPACVPHRGVDRRQSAHRIYTRKIRTCPVFWNSRSARRGLAFFGAQVLDTTAVGRTSSWLKVFTPEADAKGEDKMAKTVADQFTETLVATSHCSPPPTRRQRKPRAYC